MFAFSQAPVRIGIAGGGTDLPAWTENRTGRCLSLAIRSYTYAVAISRPDGQVVASYKARDSASSATEIANGLIRESALMHGWESGFEIHTLSEHSSLGTGLGVSSSIAVALAAVFWKLGNLRGDPGRAWADFRYHSLDDSVRGYVEDGQFKVEPDPSYPMTMAREAWTVEIDKLRRPIGRQDHMAAAHGGLRLYSFTGKDATVEKTFTAEEADWVAKHLCLIKLPDGHDSRNILASVKSTLALEFAAQAVDMAVQAIADRDLSLLGASLALGQSSKIHIPGAVTPEIEQHLAKMNQGARVYGFKLTGAGGGGHVVACCDQSERPTIAEATGLPVVAVEPDFLGVRSGGWR